MNSDSFKQSKSPNLTYLAQGIKEQHGWIHGLCSRNAWVIEEIERRLAKLDVLVWWFSVENRYELLSFLSAIVSLPPSYSCILWREREDCASEKWSDARVQSWKIKSEECFWFVIDDLWNDWRVICIYRVLVLQISVRNANEIHLKCIVSVINLEIC